VTRDRIKGNKELTPAFKTRLVTCHGGEVLPDPFEHLFALLDAGKGRRVYSLEGCYF
jgi:hypothetical protein